MDAFDIDYGYGATIGRVAVDLTGDGSKDSIIHPGRALACGHSGTIDPNRVTNNMIIHESSHGFGCDHKHGDYTFGSAGNIHGVTPMATCYVRAIDGNQSDTAMAGSGSLPSSFCSGHANETNDSYCGAVSDWCRHKFDMTVCTIDSNAPL